MRRLGRNFRQRNPAAAKTLAQKVAAILRKYGTDAHVYLPGIGVINGLTAGNYLDSAGTTPATVDNPVGKVDDAAGAIDATQATTANKPILRRGAVNLLTYSEQFDNAAWTKANLSISANAINAPDGTLTADKLVEDSANSQHRMYWTGVCNPATYTYSVYLKAGERTFAQVKHLAVSPEPSIIVNLTTGAITSPTNVVSSNAVDAGNGWWRVSMTYTTTTSTTAYPRVGLFVNVASGTYLGDGTSGIYIWGAQLQTGSVATDYIPTTTEPASSSTGNYWWQFDGSNDSLALGSVPFQMADDHCVIAGGSNLAASGGRYIFDAGNSASSSAIVGAIGFTGTSAIAQWRDNALTASMLSAPTGKALGEVNVISGRKVGTGTLLRVNGALGQAGSINAGTTTQTGAKIGVRENPANYYAGSIYPVIAIKGTVTDADLLTLEKWVGQLSGVTI